MNLKIAMIDVPIEQLFPWLQQKYDQKYSPKLQNLKKTFFIFHNLTQQIIELYNTILQECTKMTLDEYVPLKNYQNYTYVYTKQQLEPLKIVVTRTIVILGKLVDREKLGTGKPGAIDMAFCEKFIKNFGENLNILCTYYHSLNHCEIVGTGFKAEKKKIVEGINKLYTIHNKIRELYYKNDQDLKNIQNHKLYALINIGHILLERQELYKSTKNIFMSVEDQVTEFYEAFREGMRYGRNGVGVGQEGNNLDTAEQTIKNLMKNYFRILHQFSEAQAQLQFDLKPIMAFCQQIKNKKKPTNYNIADSINTFSRITSQLLKPNFSLKNFKKIRMQDLHKALFTILEDIVINSGNGGNGQGGEFKRNGELYGHRIYRQLGLGMGRGEARDMRGLGKQREQLLEKEKQKEKEKEKEKDKNRNIKEKGKDKKAPHSSSQKQLRMGSSKSKPSQPSKKQKNKNEPPKPQKQQQQLVSPSQPELEAESQISPQDSQAQYHQARKFKKNDPSILGGNETPQQKIQAVVDEICECAIFIMDCMKELEKVESSGLMGMIQEYKEKLGVSSTTPTNTTNTNTNTTNNTNTNPNQPQTNRKTISHLQHYQKHIYQYYQLSQTIKQFQKIMREIILQEFKIKINIIIGMEPKNGDGDGIDEGLREQLKMYSGGKSSW